MRAEQDDGAVADPDGSVSVDGGNDLGQLSDGERVGLTARGHAHDPAQSASHASDNDVGGGVWQTFLMVSVGDAGAVAIERPEGETGLGPLGEERGQRFGCCR
ncbi:MAG: hypothetical protein QM747_12155 [Nocardioides sp.]